MLNPLLHWFLALILLRPAQQHFLLRDLGLLVQIQLHPSLFVNQSLILDLGCEDALHHPFPAVPFGLPFLSSKCPISPLHLQMGHNNPN